MALAKVTDEWVPLQIKVFTRWVNGHLKSIEDVELQDITQDLSTGVHLVQLAQVLTQKEPPHPWKQDPKMQVFMVQNCDLAVEMFKNDGVHIVGISGKDINDNNVKLILGLVWTLILYYSIGKSIGSAIFDSSTSPNKNSSKNALMNWAVERTQDYPNVNANFQPYDLSMCALLDSYVPDKINYNSLNPEETEHNAQLATDVMNDLGIPVYIYPDDVIKSGNQVDDKTLLTQLSSAKVVLDNLTKAKERSINLQENELSAEELSDIQSLKEQNQAFREAILCLKYEVKKLKESGGLSSTNGSEDHEQLRKEIQSVQDELQNLGNSKNDNESTMVAIKCLKYEVKHLKKAIEGKSAPIADSEDSIQLLTQQNEQVERLSKEREEEKAEIEQLKKEVSELRTQLENSKNDNESPQQKEEVEKLTKEREEEKAEIERLKNEVSELRTQLENSKNDNESSQQKGEDTAEIERLRREIAELRTQFESSQAENESSLYAIKCLKYEVKQLKKTPDEIPVVKERSISLNDDAANDNAASQQKEELERLSKGREEDKAEIDRLQNDLSELRKLLENSNNENNSLKEAVESLKNEFANAKSNSEQLPEVKERSVNLNDADANDQLRKDIQSVQSELQKLNSQAQSDSTKTYLFIFVILIVLLICVKLLK